MTLVWILLALLALVSAETWYEMRDEAYDDPEPMVRYPKHRRFEQHTMAGYRPGRK